MANKRGRRSRDDYVEVVIPLVRADIWKLKDERTFAEHPGVKALMPRFTGEAWPVAWALQALLAGAVADAHSAACATRTRQAQRTAEFLQLWYDEQRTVASIAAGMHLTRSHVAKAIQRPALVLIAQRLLALAEQTDPVIQSEGLRSVLSAVRRREPGDQLKGCAVHACQTSSPGSLSA